jgi:hypothetical protein
LENLVRLLVETLDLSGTELSVGGQERRSLAA